MPEVILDQAKVVPLVGKRESAGMPEHVRMDVPKTRPLSRLRDDIVHGLTGERLPALGDKQPWQHIVARGQPTADGTQFIACQWLLDAETILET